jgi:hypothetical protein
MGRVHLKDLSEEGVMNVMLSIFFLAFLTNTEGLSLFRVLSQGILT